jgi:predicted nucleotidyltransferase
VNRFTDRDTRPHAVHHERLLADLERHARGDERVRAAWLEGSFATGTADASSDLDLHLAVTDETFDGFCADARG